MRRVSMTLAVLLMLGGSALGGCGKAVPAPAASAANTSGAGSRHASADVAFVQALIPHHREGIALASAVARQPAARTLAEAIIVTQQDEVVRMSGWLREWSASAPPSAAPSAAAPSGAAPSGAAPSGAAPSSAAPPAGASSSTAPSPAASDRSAADPIRALIAHQEEAIKLAQQEQANGTNLAALAFAKQIVESRAEEIAQLRTYLG